MSLRIFIGFMVLERFLKMELKDQKDGILIKPPSIELDTRRATV